MDLVPENKVKSLFSKKKLQKYCYVFVQVAPDKSYMAFWLSDGPVLSALLLVPSEAPD